MKSAARNTKCLQMAAKLDVYEICKRLRLGNAVREALSEPSSKSDFMLETLAEEVKTRDVNRTNLFIRQAKFPEYKSFEAYNFENVRFPEHAERSYFTDGEFVADKQGVFLYGSPGTGKTHFAIATGINLCKSGRRVQFWRSYVLAERLKDAAASGEMMKFQKAIRRQACIIIDEFGFYPTDMLSVRLLFELFSESIYEQISFILTSNIDFSEWIERSEEPHVAEAIVDRIVHVSSVIGFGGESMRVAQSVMNTKKGTR